MCQFWSASARVSATSSAFTKSLRWFAAFGNGGFPIYLNADHTHSIEKAREPAQAGFDLAVFDGSALPFEENAAETNQAVAEMKRSPRLLVGDHFVRLLRQRGLQSAAPRNPQFRVYVNDHDSSFNRVQKPLVVRTRAAMQVERFSRCARRSSIMTLASFSSSASPFSTSPPWKCAHSIATGM